MPREDWFAATPLLGHFFPGLSALEQPRLTEFQLASHLEMMAWIDRRISYRFAGLLAVYLNSKGGKRRPEREASPPLRPSERFTPEELLAFVHPPLIPPREESAEMTGKRVLPMTDVDVVALRGVVASVRHGLYSGAAWLELMPYWEAILATVEAAERPSR